MRRKGVTRPQGTPSNNLPIERTSECGSPRSSSRGLLLAPGCVSGRCKRDSFALGAKPVEWGGRQSRRISSMRLVILGGVAAGTKAASRARRLDPEIEITVYQEEPEPSISECGLPYLLSGVVEERDDLVARTPEQFADKGVEVRVRHRVERIDPENKRLCVRSLEDDGTFEDSYDRLIVATGARAVLPPIEGADLDGGFVLRFLTDSDAVRRYIAEHSPERAVVVGGGYIGL